MGEVLLHIPIPDDRFEVLDRLAKEKKISIVELSMEAILEKITAEQRRMDARTALEEIGEGLSPNGTIGPGDLSEHHDVYLYGES